MLLCEVEQEEMPLFDALFVVGYPPDVATATFRVSRISGSPYEGSPLTSPRSPLISPRESRLSSPSASSDKALYQLRLTLR